MRSQSQKCLTLLNFFNSSSFKQIINFLCTKSLKDENPNP